MGRFYYQHILFPYGKYTYIAGQISQESERFPVALEPTNDSEDRSEIENAWMGLLLADRGWGETAGRRVEGRLRLSRESGLMAVEATPMARLRI